MSTKHPIIYVTSYFPPFGAGGAERTCKLHAELLVNSGQPVTVITPNFGAASDEEMDGIHVIRVDIGRSLSQGKQIPEWLFDTPQVSKHLRAAIVESAKHESAVCIHAQHPAVTTAAQHAAAELDLPFVAHVRDTGMICSIGSICLMEPENDHLPETCGLGQNLQCRQKRWPRIYGAAHHPNPAVSLVRGVASYIKYRHRVRPYQQARRIAFASRALLNLHAEREDFSHVDYFRVVYAPLIERPGEPRVSTHQVPPDIQKLKDAGQPMILFVGKVSKGKGADVMFDAMHHLAAINDGARLVVCGNIHAGDWNIDPARVITLGFVDQSTIHALYQACDVVLLPSTWPEPLGWATLDAGRYGKPIVATRVGGIPEAIIHDETGLLVDKGDSKAMAKALADVLSSPDRMTAMGSAAAKNVREKFGGPAVLKQLDELYEGLIS